MASTSDADSTTGQLVSIYGRQRVASLVTLLSFRGNVISGWNVYLKVFHEYAYGRFYSEPADADMLLQRLHDASWIEPTVYQPTAERLPAIGLMGYNPRHLRKLADAPVSGHRVDWHWRVKVRVVGYGAGGGLRCG